MFPKVAVHHGVYATIPLRIFVDYVTILNSSPMQHLRWSSLWHKIVNGWNLFLTVLTYSFVLNVTGLLDPTLKCIDEFTLRQQNNSSAIYMFKVSKKNTRTCQMYSKWTIKTPEQCLVLLLLTLKIFHFLFYYWYSWIQTNKCWLGLRSHSFRHNVCFQ